MVHQFPNIWVIGIPTGEERKEEILVNTYQKFSDLKNSCKPVDPRISTTSKHRKHEKNFTKSYLNQIAQNQ